MSRFNHTAALDAAGPVAIDLANRTWQGIPGLERTANGRVFVSWFTGGPKEPAPENTVVLCYSDDDGRTFSAPQAMALPLDDGMRCYDPCLWIDPKGRLWYLFNRGNKDTARHDEWARICDDPDATPPVWGAEFRVGFDGPFSFRMNKPVVLSSGEWLMPVTLALNSVHAWCTGYNDRQEPTLHGVGISTDEGRTWKLHVALNNFGGRQNAIALVHDDLATFEVLGHYNEPQSQQLSESAVNRLPDGTWMAICRNDAGNYHFTTSPDGRTWSVAREMPFVPNGANSKPTFDRFGGVYYLGWQEATRVQGVSRSVFNVDISRDGCTWERKYRFETPQSFQYPTFHEHEGTIWLSVTQGDSDPSRKERIMFGKLEDCNHGSCQKKGF